MRRRPILILSLKIAPYNILRFSELLASAMDFEIINKTNDTSFSLDEIDQYVESNDVAMLLVAIDSNKTIQTYLSKFRKMRVPYIFIKKDDLISFENISIPVTYLEEEKEKAPFATSFARFLKSKLIIHRPKDYGSKAQKNIDTFISLFSKFDINYTIEDSEKNSEKVELDAAMSAVQNNVGMVIITASREYGLDDIIFGPKERKIISSSRVPIMLINPRADLYMLCD